VRGLGRFHDLGKDAAHVLRVDEEDEGAVGADARFAEDACAFGFELGLGRMDVGDFEADVMLAAERVPFEEAPDGRGFAERLDQFDLRIGCVDEADPDRTPCAGRSNGSPCGSALKRLR
jgi:hypothetical protein